MVFDMGREIEEIVLKELREAGFQIHEGQRAFSWPEYGITGSIDGMIIMDGEAIPLEIKSASPFAYDSINSVEDIKKHKYPYMRRYLSQVTLYCLMSNKDRAVLLFKNKVSGALKEIWVPLDYELGETLLKRAEAINAHVAAGTIPDRITDERICEDCPFLHICIPDHIGREVEILDDGELVELLTRQEELKPIKKEYEEIDSTLKKKLEGRDKLMVGPFYITGKYVEKKSFTVPESKYWQRKVTRP